ncbi:MAG: hypothetical protein RBG13Loki_2436 [Promethearchaeota archaeon CR_4]|nr:MAG: hypothetical protein RBG13Loki_2436 [Candidatus Lokiarchaeota archaeon CR_4]
MQKDEKKSGQVTEVKDEKANHVVREEQRVKAV